MKYSRSQTQSNAQSTYIYDLELLKLVKFNRRSTEVYYLPKPFWMSKRQWAFDPSNPKMLSEREKEFIKICDEIRHKSGKNTFFRQGWIARRLGVSKETIRLWIRKLKFLGIIEVEKTFHYKWINTYIVTPEFTQFKCEADQILAPCTKADHSECIRPEVSYKCQSCHRFMSGLSVEEQHSKELDTLRSSLNVEITKKDQEIAELKKEVARLTSYNQAKAKAREERRVSKGKAREYFLSKFKEEEKAIIYTYEEVTGRKFDPAKDLKALNQINKQSPIVAIIGILQTAINLLAKDKSEGKELKGLDINEAMKKASIYSLQYCVGQVEKVASEFKAAFIEVGKEINPSKTVMGYLGTTIATLDARSALEVLGIIKALPAKTLGGRAGIQQLLGIYVSKMVSRQVRAGLIEEEDRAEVFNEYLASLLIEFDLRR